MTVFTHNDSSRWGERFLLAAGRAGVQCELFENPTEVPAGGAAFVRLDQCRGEREKSKWIVAELNRLGVHTMPTAAEGVWYDDKVAQVEPLRDYLPDTYVITHRDEAIQFLKEGILSYPFISKSKDGASSAAVRFIENEQQAYQEIIAAFSDTGFKSIYDRIQQGYLYWQEFLPYNDGDIRIIVMGDYFMGLWRKNRKDKPFASGSGNNGPIVDFNTVQKYREAAEVCLKFADEVKTRWMAFDVVFNQAGVACILELSSSWTPKAYEPCPLFYREDFRLANRTGAEMFDIAVEITAGLSE